MTAHPETPNPTTASPPERRPGLTGHLQEIVEAPPLFQRTIIGLIVLNAITLGGLETSPRMVDLAGPVLHVLDRAVLVVFVIELLLKLVVYRTRFHRDPWNLFDAAVVGIALMPATGALSVLRALRILRVLRLISAVPSMRRVVGALVISIPPGIGSILGLLSLVYYVFAVMATKLFGADFPPEWFGNIGASAYSLFQIMTLESWSMGIVRPVMEVYPYAWLFFLPFLLLTTFTVLNLFIGIVVDAIQSQHEAEHADDPEVAEKDIQTEMLTELRALRAEVAELRAGR